jgi:hypothetical protein
LVALKCFELAAGDFEIPKEGVKQLMAADQFQHPEDRQRLYDQLICCISPEGDKVANPFLIPALFALSDDVRANCDLLRKLLQIGSNPIKFHRAEVDLFLIDWIREHRNFQNCDETIFRIVLNTFRGLATQVCSPTVVAAFVSLLTPIEGHLVVSEPILLETVNQMVTENFRQRSRFSALSDPVQVSQFTLESNFSAIFWIYSATEEEKMIQIFKAVQENVTLRISTNGSVWNLVLIQGDSHISVDARGPLPRNHWNFIAIGFTGGSFSISENLVEQGLYDLTTALHGEFEGTIGDPDEVSKSDNRLGYFALTAFLGPDEIESTYSLGPAVIPQPLFLLASFPIPPATAIIPQGGAFANVLLNDWNFDLLLPLPQLFDLPMSNGLPFENLCTIFFDLLAKSLVFNRPLEQNFFQTNKLYILAFWLLTIDAKYIDYDMYIKLYEIFHCLSDRRLREQFLDDILVNPEIWSRVSRDDSLKIVSHWVYVVFPSSKEIVVTVRPFSQVFCHLTLYFPFEKSDSLDITGCRNLLRILMLMIAQLSFSRTDFEEVISQIVHSPDTRTSEDLLQLLKLLALDSQALSSIELELSDILPLIKLVDRKDSSLTMSLIKTILEFYEHGILSDDSLPYVIQLLLLKFRGYIESETLYQFATEQARLYFSHSIAIPFWYFAEI